MGAGLVTMHQRCALEVEVGKRTRLGLTDMKDVWAVNAC